MDAEKRYQNDPVYKGLVTAMEILIEEGSLAPDDIISAAELARKKNKEQSRSSPIGMVLNFRR